MDATFSALAIAQLWQVTALIVFVAVINRWLSRRRPHLAHVLWLVVLAKCLTPPLWSSSGGIFCWLQPEQIEETQVTHLDVEWEPVKWEELLVADSSAEGWAAVQHDSFAAVPLSDAEAEELLGPEEIPASTDWSAVLRTTWLVTVTLVLLVVAVRWWRFWRRLKQARRRECPELDQQLAELAQQFGVKRVRLLVTECRIGPAVVGLFRKTILLPAVVVDRLASRSQVSPKPGDAQRPGDLSHADSTRSSDLNSDEVRVSEKLAYDSLLPILAHELLHVRRGDLWVGMLQTITQAVWWFHPLVWWVGKATSREAERCCDEEVLAELKCDPATYARSLLDVLELKSQLAPVPVFPGVRPVDVTSNRLERIMTLRQGCRRRTPWWCWLIAIGAAALTLPGAAFVVSAQEEAPLNGAPVPLPALKAGSSQQPAPAAVVDEEYRAYQIADRDSTITTVVYETAEFAHLLTGTKAEQQQKFERLVRSRRPARDAQINWFNGKPVVKATVAGHTAVRKCLTMFVGSKATAETFDQFLASTAGSRKATLVCELQMISAKESIFSQLEDVVLEHSIDPDGPGRWVIPDEKWTEALRSIKGDAYHVSSPQVATHNGVNVQIESVRQHSSGLKREDDGSLTPCMNWSGWKTHLLPFVKDDGSIWVGVWIEQGTITDTRWPTDKEVVQRGVTKPVSIHSYEVLNLAATLKDDQIVVLPGLETTADTDSEEWPLLTLRIRRLSDKPDPNSLPSPRRVSQTEPQSNEGVIGEIELASGVKQASRSRTERKSYRVTNFLTQRSLGTSTLTLRSQNDGLRMAVKLENADTKEVLAGTAEDVRVHSKPDSSIVEMQNAKFRIFSDPGQRLIADKLMILSGSDSQLHQKLQLELQGAEIQLRTSGRRSQIKAESVNLKLNAATLSIEQLNASGLDSLKADPERISIASVYPVPDLVVPTIESFVVNVTGVGLTGVTPQWKSIEASGQPSNDRVAELIELISETIEPDSWQDNGGPGIVAFNESSLSLVVRQTQEVHEQIVDLLGQLRRLQDHDVALQMHTRVVDQGFLEKTGVDVTFEENGDSSSPKFAKLSRSDVEALRAESMWMPLPKITLLNGQGCHVILPDHADQRVSLWPAVSADRRFVRMSLATGQNRDTSPKPTLTLNDGGAFLVSLPRKSSEQQYLVIVKSDVHFVEEEEELLGIEAGPGGDP